MWSEETSFCYQRKFTSKCWWLSWQEAPVSPKQGRRKHGRLPDQHLSNSTGQSLGCWSRQDTGNMGKQQLFVSNGGCLPYGQRRPNTNKQMRKIQGSHAVKTMKLPAAKENRCVRRVAWGAECLPSMKPKFSSPALCKTLTVPVIPALGKQRQEDQMDGCSGPSPARESGSAAGARNPVSRVRR